LVVFDNGTGTLGVCLRSPLVLLLCGEDPTLCCWDYAAAADLDRREVAVRIAVLKREGYLPKRRYGGYGDLFPAVERSVGSVNARADRAD
jgi:hypothetical protein